MIYPNIPHQEKVDNLVKTVKLWKMLGYTDSPVSHLDAETEEGLQLISNIAGNPNAYTRIMLDMSNWCMQPEFE